MFRQLFEKYQVDECDIYESIPNSAAGVTSVTEVAVLRNEPCRLCFCGSTAASDSDTRSSAVLTAKLFLNSGTDVRAGSRVTVRRGGKVYNFTSAGVCSYYLSHTEVPLKVTEELL